MTSGRPLPPLNSCDTLIARSPAFPERAIFGKNSDRPADEAQPLEAVPAATHPPGAHVRCQYLTIPQASRTLAVLGSRPWWLWGFEHGVNEAGVAIGNEAIYTRDETPDTGLLGMDLVRLGLERGATARDALEYIIELLETYGQGGTAVIANRFAARYHNSFIIADAREAYILETSARHWVYRRTTERAAIANLLTIEDDWDCASEGIESYARDRGWWWGPSTRRFNFRLAFEDREMRANTQDRYAASCRFLEQPVESMFTVPAMMRHLRDHFESGVVHTPETPDVLRPRSICCHPGRFASATTASLVVELTPEQSPPIAWCSMATPCTGVFLPIEVGSPIPAALSAGGGIEDDVSVWWALRGLSEIVEHDPPGLTPSVQEVWAPWERELLDETAADPASASRLISERVAELLARRAMIIEKLAPEALSALPSRS